MMNSGPDIARVPASTISPPLPQFPSRPASNGPSNTAKEDTKPSRSPGPGGPPASSRSPHPTTPASHEFIPGYTSSSRPFDSALDAKPRTGSSSRPRTPRQPATSPPPGTSVKGGEDESESKPLSGPDASSPDASRPLNVTDALTYLDAVKMQFQDKPDVYNHFLDIMKDFKSQMIDTPGVIERVSALFQGNPYLIQGFNTFLPPGYRIELSTDPRNANLITVTTPLGILRQTAGAFTMVLQREPHHNMLSPFPNQLPFGPPPPVLPVGLGPGSRPATPMHQQLPPGLSAFADMLPPRYSPDPHSSQAAANAAQLLNGLGNRTAERGAPAVQFNHAIQFLNEIKIRFKDEPDTYKQFLEILQTYQKEQRQLHDSQVFAQVSMLFKNAPDLMEEFRDFLPAAMGIGAQHGGLIGIMPHPTGAPPGWDLSAPIIPESDKPPAKAPASRRRKRAADKEPPAPAQPKAATGRAAKRAKLAHKPDAGSPKYAGYELPPSPPPAQHPPSQALYTQLPQQQLPPHGLLHLPQNALSMGQSLSTQDELILFDRIKKALESAGLYEEFLKLLGMFSHDIVDVRTLVDRAEVFLGGGDLMLQFKLLMGYDEKQGNVEYGPPGSIRTSAPDPLAAQNPEDGESPSYRRLPDAEIRLACSGRDQLHRSVLNDEWVSHPTWASEEAGFMTHKKNVFEDTLHKSEEERHEYQVHIEAMVRTIAVLDPLNTRIAEMSAEERVSFRLKPNLGGPSRAVYEKVVKKVYGRDAGLEVLKALVECPGVAVPVVLLRLKQKCEEWRRLQREWSRTWREVDAKNFYKALDHQGITFKQNDKKNITTKSFVQEIEQGKAEHYKNREELGLPLNLHEPCNVALQFDFADTGVLHDSLKIVYSYLDHSQSQYSAMERRGVERFLRSFIPTLFQFAPHEFNAACGPLDTTHEDEHMDADAETADEGRGDGGGSRRSASGTHQGTSTGVAAGDLRKRLLKTVQEDLPHARNASNSSSLSGGSASPAVLESPLTAAAAKQASGSGSSGRGGEVRSNPDDVWIREMVTDLPDGWSGPAGDAPVTRRPFFANTTFYVLLRLLQLLYSRLLVCKEIGAKLAKEKHASLLANPVAVELGLDEPNGPAVILEQAIEGVGSSQGDAEPNVLYLYLLDACEKVFDNELDQATFEEHMRWFFGTKAYHVFTLDRVIIAIIKQVQSILGDYKGQELWTQLQRARSKEQVVMYDIMRYRREAERNMGSDDHLYRVDWDVGSRVLRIQLVGLEEPSVGEEETGVGRWREYVASYVSRYATEWVNTERTASGRRPYLKRTAVEETDVRKTSGLGVRVCAGSYKLVYEAGGEDVLWRRVELGVRALEKAEERKRSRYLK